MNGNDPQPQPPAAPTHLPDGGGEMGELIRAFDWSRTPLGPVASWSPALHTTLRIMLANRFPHILWWGPEYIQFYNDSYRPIPGSKHPDRVLGQPARQCWSEIWDVIGPLIDRPFRGGPATWDDDILLEVHRHGFTEESHFVIAYSPVPDETAAGGIGGVLATVHEISEKVVGERRVKVLRDLGSRVGEARTAEEACAVAAETLALHPLDIPFALFYLIDSAGERARLAGAAGGATGAEIAPSEVDLRAAGGAGWPFFEAAGTDSMLTVERLGESFATVPSGPWSAPPHTAIVVRVPSNRAQEHAALLVLGVSARLRFDAAYRDFFSLVRTQVAAAIAHARAYEEEKRRAEELAALDRAKTAFFSNVSHEFRTPLTLMLGPVEDLLGQDKGEIAPAAREQLESVNRNGRRLLRLVNTLLDFSRIEAGRVRASFQATDLAVYTADLASNFRSAVERAGLRLVVDCEPLPEPVYVDRDMWEKIVLNLLSNAFKFTFEGTITARLSCAASGDRVELYVEDTGTGIPADEIPRLFERFHRVSNARGRTHEGSGIGLALVQELVKLHGGSIQAASELQRGTTFTVTIPLGTRHLPAAQLRTNDQLLPAVSGAAATSFVDEALHWLPETGGDGGQKEEEDAAAVAGSEGERELAAVGSAGAGQSAGDDRPYVLVADDNADMRRYIARLLSPFYRVELYADGQAALEAARRRTPELILSDVMMPRLGGFELLRILRADDALRETPFILLSARAGEESRIEGIDASADDYLVKPFSARELIARVDSHLKMARLRREARRAVADSEARLRALVTASSDVIYRMNADWTEMRHLHGRQFLADTLEPSLTWLQKYIFPQDHPEVTQAIQRTIESKSVFEMEHRLIRIDGTFGWVHSRAIPISDASGAIGEWFGTASDITARKGAEALLAEQNLLLERIASGERREAVLTALTAAVARLQPGARACVLLANLERSEISDVYSAQLPREFGEAFIGTPFDEAGVVTGTPDWTEAWKELGGAHGIVACRSTPVFGAEGSAIAALVLCLGEARMPTAWEARIGELGGHIASIVLERDRAAEALAEAAERLELAVGAAELGTFYCPMPLARIVWNARCKEHFFLPADAEIDFDLFYSLLHEEDRERIREAVERAIHAGERYDVQYRTVTGDGRTRWIRAKGRAYYDAAGRPTRFDGITIDISDVKRIEEERDHLFEAERAARAAAERASYLKDEFLATLSHELRTPLGAILGWSQLMASGRLEAQTMKEGLAVISRNARIQTQLIEDLLDMSRILSGKLRLDMQAVQMADVIKAAIESVKPSADAKGIHIEPVIEPVSGVVAGDPARLQQVAWNLLTNAVKFTPKGGRVTIVLECVGARAEIVVSDTGQGIKPEFLPFLFERFRQADASTTRHYGGLGIGLSLVKELVELHGGSVRAQSAGEGRGATFVVSLPLSLSPHALGAPGTRDTERRAGELGRDVELRGVRVLYVDDDADARALGQRILGECEAQVTVAASAREALDLLKSERPDVLISDIGMPDVDGYRLIRWIRQLPRDEGGETPAAALTAFARSEDRRRALLAGYQSHIAKPVEPDELITVVASLAGKVGKVRP